MWSHANLSVRLVEVCRYAQSYTHLQEMHLAVCKLGMMIKAVNARGGHQSD